MKKKQTKKFHKKVLTYAGIILLCAVCTGILLLIVGVQSGSNEITAFAIADSPNATGFSISAVGIFLILLISLYLNKTRAKFKP